MGRGIFIIIVVCLVLNFEKKLFVSTCPTDGAIYHGDGYVVCYWVTTGTMSATSGYTTCQLDGGTVGEVPDSLAFNFLKCALTTITEPSIWIGYNDIANEGVFVTWSGQPMMWHNFHHTQPSNTDGVEHCVEVNVNSAPEYMHIWNDRNCGHSLRVLCSKYISQNSPLYPAALEITNYTAKYHKMQVNDASEVGAVIGINSKSRSIIECLALECKSKIDCDSGSFNKVTGICQAFECPKVGIVSAFPVGENIWLARK